jgi:hypothetical protein
MLDKISIPLLKLRDVGNNVAHGLRIAPARVRARLERCRAQSSAGAELVESLDPAIGELGHTAATIAELLRIGEIEKHHRRSRFADVWLAFLAQGLFKL